MKHVLLWAVIAVGAGFSSTAALSRFEKVTERFYYLKSGEGAANVGALVTEDGVLLVDTPSAKDVPVSLEALKRLTPRPVRWVISTHEHEDHTGGNSYFLEHNAAVIGSRRPLRPGEAETANDKGSPRKSPLFAFGREMRLFPGGIEVRVMAVEHPAHTAADVIVLIPSERVLQIGDLFMAGSYPEIDMVGGGSPLGWFDAMKRVIEAVPLAKPAIPQPKPGTSAAPEEEKTLEELVAVIPGHGPASNLREVKDLLESAQRLRNETARAISLKRTRDAFLTSVSLTPSFSARKNLDLFAAQLYEVLSHKK